jgi:hypothetical protein
MWGRLGVMLRGVVVVMMMMGDKRCDVAWHAGYGRDWSVSL